MSRRKHPQTTKWVAWKPSLAELFRLAPTSWTPPGQVKVRRSERSMTITARFVDPRGHESTALIRLTRNDGEWDVIEERLATHLELRLEAPSA